MFQYRTSVRAEFVGLVAVITLAVLGLVRPALLEAQTSGSIIYVQPAAVGAGDGSSWDNATTLQDALQNRAAAGTEIWVAAGTHYPATPSDPAAVTEEEREATFQISSGVAVYGGFAGTETSRDARDPAVNISILSGDIDQDDELDAGNSWTVVDVSGTDATTVLDGVTITAGNADVESLDPVLPSNAGGGIFNVGGSPTLTNLQIIGNEAWASGGGIYNADNSSPSLTDVTFEGNFAANGGGVHNINASSPTFVDVTITGNRGGLEGGGVYNGDNSSPSFTDVTIADNLDGGGVYNGDNSNPTFTNVIISGNEDRSNDETRDIGGVTNDANSNPTFTAVEIIDNGSDGIWNRDSSPSFTNVTIRNNGGFGVRIIGASNPSFTGTNIIGNTRGGVDIQDTSSPIFTDVIINGNPRGGVINASAGQPVFTNVTIANNRSETFGGGVANSAAAPIFRNVTISGNQAAQGGGGVYNTDSSNPIFTNVIITGNQTDQNGGGMLNASGSMPLLTNVTISGNRALVGGGMFNDASTLRVRNSIIWDNGSGDGPQVFNAGSTVDYAFTLVQGVDLTGEGTGNLDGSADPQFVAPLAPEFAPTIEGDYMLQSGSPVIDMGKLLFLDETTDDVPDLNGDGDEEDTIDTDLAGNARLFGVAVDLGAYEVGDTAPTPEPVLTANFTTGSPGSSFLLTGTNLTPDTTFDVLVNGTPLGTLTVDVMGGLTVVLDMSAAGLGEYVITTEQTGQGQATEQEIRITLAEDAPLRTVEPGAADDTIIVPADLAAPEMRVYLPLLVQ